ncbi:MAG: endo-1,4-beta-xylanase [Thermoguttaceae bacterium]|nr:endo-1,4-beta-xylanase [Thermoguttaceae bacterium]
MKKLLLSLAVIAALISASAVAQTDPAAEPDPGVMSDAYYQIWNDDVQKAIDERIEKYRKADAVVELTDVQPGSEIKVEQISHEFIFGAHIFNFNQLGTTQRNEKYKALYGTLFNSATIAFYWQRFEMEPGKPRFKTEQWDTEEFWNTVQDPKSQPHWRRPASDQVVEFCKSKGIRLHGHTIIWGNQKWQRPTWLWDYVSKQFPEEREILFKTAEARKKMSPAEIYKLAPHYFDAMNELYWNRIRMLGEHYKGTLDSWDVVNESATDYHGQAVTGDKVTKSKYGHVMPGDYTYNSFKIAQEVFPDSVKLNINDYANNQNYADQVNDLVAHGAKIDIVGSQMHLFRPQQTLDIAAGAEIQTPTKVLNTMKILATTGRPIHLSEITITAPNDDANGRAIQAIVARNLYRLWFSVPEMMGITWWNVVDDCGAPGEPTTSGLFTRNMEPKPSYFALNKLINEEWKTNFVQKADAETVTLQFRGFKGKYRATWTDKNGKTQSKEFTVK